MSDAIDKDTRMWGMFCHLSGLVALTGIPLGGIIAPLIIWQIKKDQHPFIDAQGKEAVNFQITLGIGLLVALVLMCTGVGAIIAIPLMFVLGIGGLVLMILAGLKANNGEDYRYPFAIRLIK